MGRLLTAALAALIAAEPMLALAQEAQPGPPTTVEGLVVSRAMAPVPNVGKGAPLFTVGEIKEVRDAAFQSLADANSDGAVCGAPPDQQDVPSLKKLHVSQANASRRVMLAADKAMEATAAATQSRVDAAAGKIDQRALERAELARQQAVAKYLEARVEHANSQAMIKDLMELLVRFPQPLLTDSADERARKADGGGLPASLWNSELQARQAMRDAVGSSLLGVTLTDQYPQMRVGEIIAEARDDARGAYMIVRGQVYNDRSRQALIPPLQVVAADARGNPLSTVVIDPPGGVRIAAKGKQSFTYEFRPRPETTRNIAVTFAPPHMFNPGSVEHLCELEQRAPDPFRSGLNPGSTAIGGSRANGGGASTIGRAGRGGIF